MSPGIWIYMASRYVSMQKEKTSNVQYTTIPIEVCPLPCNMYDTFDEFKVTTGTLVLD